MAVRVRVCEADGRRIRYYEAATAEAADTPLLLIHGAGASADTWIRNLETLGATRRVVAPDLAGHGFSAFESRGMLPPQVFQVHYLLRFLAAVGVDRFDVLGSSFGGLVAALLALEVPSRVRRVVLVGTASVFHPAEDQGATLAGVGANQSAVYADPTLAALRARNCGSNHACSDGFEEILAVQASFLALGQHRQGFEDTLQGLKDSAADPEARVVQRLEQLRQPTLVIQGRDDPRVILRHVESGVTRLPDARLVVLADCGHKPYAEHPHEFNDVVTGFLGEPRPA